MKPWTVHFGYRMTYTFYERNTWLPVVTLPARRRAVTGSADPVARWDRYVATRHRVRNQLSSAMW